MKRKRLSHLRQGAILVSGGRIKIRIGRQPVKSRNLRALYT